MDERVLVDYVCLQACQGFNRYSVLFIFRSAQERGRSRLASCGNRSGEGTHGTGIRGPRCCYSGLFVVGTILAFATRPQTT